MINRERKKNEQFKKDKKEKNWSASTFRLVLEKKVVQITQIQQKK